MRYGNECTFHLPITETRFKRRRNDATEDDSFRAREKVMSDFGPSRLLSNGGNSPQSGQSLPHISQTSTSRSKYDGPPVGGVGPNYRPEGRIYGETPQYRYLPCETESFGFDSQ